MTNDQNDNFGKMGRVYQEKCAQALLTDTTFAEQMADVIDPEFFDVKYLQEIVKRFYDYKQKYKTYPSIEMVEIITCRDDPPDDMVVDQVKTYLRRVVEDPLNGDMGYVQESSLDFCKRQTLKEAMIRAIDRMQESDYDSIQTIIKEALNKGSNRDIGHEYMEGFSSRGSKSVRSPISTGWPLLDKEFNGGWERGPLSTFIAPTGAGKSMFLVNCGAAGVANGYNVLYVTCEMADYKIGLRFDSYYSGIEINAISENQEQVEAAARQNVKGRLFIKEFSTKSASVQTIRAAVQRLQVTKGFVPDIIVVDYADLLRSIKGYGDKRFELEGIYEDLRAFAQELNCVIITADQTNRSGLDMEVVTIGQIGESYAKATVCDVIMTVSRKMEDKQSNSGRLFIAKSRLGRDGMVYPFLLNPATVKVTLLNQGEDPISLFLENRQALANKAGERFNKLTRAAGLTSLSNV